MLSRSGSVASAPKQKPPSLCVYCGAAGPSTADHVPPRNIFPKPRPRLITVPSCRACNEGFASNDEYLRLILVSRWDTGDEAADSVWQAAMRGIGRRERLGLARRFLQGATEVRIGPHNVGMFTPEIGRLEAVAERIARGLFWHRNGRRIPSEVRCKGVVLELLDHQFPISRALAQLARGVTQGTATTIGDKGEFAYWHEMASGQTYQSAWVMKFYRFLSLAALVGDEN
jgi:hypothetical protein